MGSPRFTLKFMDDAVKQVVEWGYSVAEVSARFGVSLHSLYKWVKAVTPNESEQQSKELLEAKHEILHHRVQMRSVEEERNILNRSGIIN